MLAKTWQAIGSLPPCLAREQAVVLVGQRRELGPRDHVAADQPEQDLAVELRQMRRHLGDVALRDRRGAARDLLAHGLARAPARVDRREVAADERDVARPAEGVADPERADLLLVAGDLMHDPRRVLAEEAHPGVARLRLDEAALALDLDVLADDLDQVLARRTAGRAPSPRAAGRADCRGRCAGTPPCGSRRRS